ncbi:MAG: gliding motility-associated C-terminal domain-containing protein [Saprospiraceae bacterium]
MIRRILSIIVVAITTIGFLNAQPCDIPPGVTTCQAAGITCQGLDGYCATLETNSNGIGPNPLCNGTGVPNNIEWFAFIAGSTTISIQLTPSNCNGVPNPGGNPFQGIQAGIYSDCSFSTSMACQSNCTINPFTLTNTSYVIGQTYYIFIDGCAGDVCDYSVEVTNGSTDVPQPTTPNPVGTTSICPNATGPNGTGFTYSVPAVSGAVTYTWEILPAGSGGVIAAGQGTPTINVDWSGSATGGTVCVTVSNDCFTASQECINVTTDPIIGIDPPAGEYCENEPGYIFPGDGMTYTDGSNSITFTSWQGCDSTVTLVVTENPNVEVDIYPTICAGDTWFVAGIPHTMEGAYEYNSSVGLFTFQGCDSTVRLNLTVEDPVAFAAAAPFNCSQGTVQLLGSSTWPDVVTYFWTGPGIDFTNENDQSPTVSLPGTYFLTVSTVASTFDIEGTMFTKPPCESQPFEIEVMFDAGPTASAGADMEINCTTTCVTLDGSGSSAAANFTYTWGGPGIDATNINDQSPTVCAAGTYTITVTDTSNGCISTDMVDVINNTTNPVASAGADMVLTCLATCVTLDGSGSATGATISYEWSGPGIDATNLNDQSPNVCMTGIYTITVTDSSNGCTATDDVEVTQDAGVPTASAGADMEINCTTTCVTLDGSGSTAGLTYTWSGPGIDATNINDQSPNICTAGTYTITVTNTANGCTATDMVDVALNATLPTASAGADMTINCINTCVTLDGSGSTAGLTYTWSGPGIDATNINDQSPTVCVQGTYTITVTEVATGCTATDDVIVDENITVPTASAGADMVLTCLSGSVTLDGSGSTAGMTYLWSGPGIDASNENDQSPSVVVSGTYTITVTDPVNGCSATDDVEVTQDAGFPTASAGADMDITCLVTCVTLDGSGSDSGAGITYTWTGPGIDATNENDQSPTVCTAGTYSLVVNNTNNGCTATDAVDVILNNTNPVASAGADMTITCNDPCVTLDGSGSDSGADITYTWTGPGIDATNENDQNPTVCADGNYTLTVANTTTGCSDTDNVTVTANTTLPTASAGADMTITCIVTSVTLDGSGSTSGLTYLWTGPGIDATNENDQSPTVTVDGNYVLVVTNAATGCSATDDVDVDLDATLPTASAGADMTITCNDPCVTLDGSGSDSGPGITYTWTGPGIDATNENDQNPSVCAPGNYSLTVTIVATGCTEVDDVDVDEDTTPPAASAGADMEVTCLVTCVTLDGSGSDSGTDITYLWSGPGIDATNENDQSPTVCVAGDYTITVTNTTNGCTSTDDVEVTEDVNLPTASAGADMTLTCAVTSVTLDGSGSTGGLTYTWVGPGIDATNENDQSPTVTVAGIYTITVFNPTNGCSTTDDVEVFEDITAPTASAGADMTLTCTVTSVTLDGSGSTAGLTYTWVGPGIDATNENDQSPTVTAAGIYTITVFNPTNGCSTTDDVEVFEDITAPTADAGLDMVVTCAVTCVTLDGSASDAGMTYLWTGPGIDATNENDQSPSVCAPGNYTLLVTNPTNGCTATDDVEVTEDVTAPIAAAGGDMIIDCINTCVTLDGSGSDNGMTYLWTGPGIDATNENDQSPTVCADGTYTLLVTNATNGCTATDEVDVTLNVNLPAASAGPDAQLTCTVTSVTLDGSGSATGLFITYLWTGPGIDVSNENDQSPTVNVPGNYVLVVSDASNGCTSTDDVEVTQDITPPTASAGADLVLTCVVTSVTLDGSGSSTGANFDYLWTGPSIDATNENDQSPSVMMPGTYNLTVTNTATGCTAMDEVEVTLDAGVPVASAGPDSLLTCLVTTIVLDGSGSSVGLDFTYTWTGPGINGGNMNDQNPSISLPGTYTISVENTSNGCIEMDEVIITEDVTLPIVAGGPDRILNCDSTTVTLDGSASVSGANFVYTWSGPGINAGNMNMVNPVVAVPGNYTLSIENTINNCTATDDVVVTEDLTAANSDAGADQVITCGTTSVTLDGSGADSGPNISYLWTGPGIDASNENTQNPTVSVPGTYTLTTINETTGCSTTDDVDVTVDAGVPSINAGADQTINCLVSTVTIDGSGSDNGMNIQFEWSGPGIDATNINDQAPTVSTPGTYTLVITDTNNGCSATDNVDVILDITPPVAAAVSNSILSCTVPSVVIDGSGSDTGANFSYSWTGPGIDGTNMTDQSPTVTVPGMYTLLVTNTTSGCTATDDVDVLLDSNTPVASAGQDSTLTCAVSSLILDGSGSSTGADIEYLWTGPSIDMTNETVQTPEISLPGTYSVTVTNTTNGCTDIDEVIIIEDTVNPTASAGPDQELTCLVTTVTLDGSGSSTGTDITYNWSGPAITAANQNDQSPVVDQPGMYVVAVFNTANGCSAISQVMVTQDIATPTADAGGDVVLSCALTDVTLNGSGSQTGMNITYTWSGPGITAGNANELSPQVSVSGLYTLLVTNTTNGCTATDDVNVSQDAGVPTASAGPDQTLDCNVSSVTLDGSGSQAGANITYTWSGPGITAANENDQSPIVDAAGSYTLIVLNTTNGCSGTDIVEVIGDFDPPTATAAGGVIDCDNPSVQLTGSSVTQGATYSWTGPGITMANMNQQNPIVSVPGNDYVLTVTGPNGCTNTAMATVTQDANLPIAVIAQPATLTCAVTTVPLDASGSSQGANFTYEWTGGGITGNATLNPDVSVATSYTLVVTNTDNGCTQTATMVVPQDIAPPIADAAVTDNLDCIVTSVDLDGSGSSAGANISYEWTGPNVTAGATTLSPSVDDAGTYTIVVTNNENGCSSSDDVEVLADDDIPNIERIELTTPDCYGDQNGVILIDSVSGGAAPYLYSFDDGENFTPVSFLSNIPAGNYDIVIQDANGCEFNQEVSITEPAEFTVDLGDDIVIGLGDEVRLDAFISEPNRVDTLLWTPLVDTLFTDLPQQAFSPLESGNYSVTIIDENGCIATDQINVRLDKERLVYVPNAFSPDGNGPNDLFQIYTGAGVEEVQYFRVFDRWGEVVYQLENFQANNPALGWDGTLNNKKLNPGVYVYIASVKFIDGREILYKGDVTLMR